MWKSLGAEIQRLIAQQTRNMIMLRVPLLNLILTATLNVKFLDALRPVLLFSRSTASLSLTTPTTYTCYSSSSPAVSNRQNLHPTIATAKAGVHDDTTPSLQACSSQRQSRVSSMTLGFPCSPRTHWTTQHVMANPRRYGQITMPCTTREVEADMVGEDGPSGGDVGAKAEFGLGDNVLEDLWRRPRKHLLSVGKTGVKKSHLRSLRELVQAHTLVKVKINIPRADLDEVALQLCGRAPIDGIETTAEELEEMGLPAISVVMYRSTQNVILFGDTQFLKEEAAA